MNEAANEITTIPPEGTKKEKPLSKRLWIAVPMAILFLVLGIVLYFPGMFLGGMMTDSCSGGNSYLMWQIWLVYLWPLLLAAAALLPPFFVIKNRPVKTVLLAVAAGFGANLLWYLLWIPVLSISGC